MPLSWNEIRDRSMAFSREWATECSEDAEAKSFWDGFFNVFGITQSDYCYSAGIVYNNFPWPDVGNVGARSVTRPGANGNNCDDCDTGGSETPPLQKKIETAAQGVLAARAKFPTSTLADLYDPLTMPPELVKAHQALDRAVDVAYGKQTFKAEAERVAFLFERYQELVAPLVGVGKVGKSKKKILSKGNDSA